MSTQLDSIKSAAGKAYLGPLFWSLFDQAIFAGANFLINLLFARNSQGAEYGAFALALALLTIPQTIQTALITEPMLIYGSQIYKSNFNEYRMHLNRMHWLLLCPACACMAITGGVMYYLGSVEAAKAWLSIAFFAPVIQLSVMDRRACYVFSRQRVAAFAGVIYLVLMLGGSYIMLKLYAPSTFVVVLIMAASSLISHLWLTSACSEIRAATPQSLDYLDVRARHFSYGRWALSSLSCSWVVVNFNIFALNASHGLEANGVLKALTNLIAPFQIAITTIPLLLMPYFSVKASFPVLLKTTVLVFFSASVFWLILGWNGHSILSILYSQKNYIQYSDLVWLIALMPVSDSLNAVLGSFAKVVCGARTAFWAYFFSAVWTLSGGAWLTWKYGTQGAIIACLSASGLIAVILAGMCCRQYMLTTLSNLVREDS